MSEAKDESANQRFNNDSPPQGRLTSEVKDLFGLMLEASEISRLDSAHASNAPISSEAHAAFEAAPSEVQVAVKRLLAAHERASGLLLDAASDTGDPDPVENDSSRVSRAPATFPPQIDGYDVGEEIGRGGFGVVHRARQLRPVERTVAVKILRADLASPEVISRFRAEACMLARMSSPGIARVLDAGLDALGRPFVAMELVEGMSITAYCERSGLSIRERLQLMADVCEAVHHAHQRMVIHRDLKPANILIEEVDGRPRARVIDFGIAKIIEEGANEAHTVTGARLGTPKYMSPEQAAGSGGDDVRTDVYALGVVLCEVLTGSVPRDPIATGGSGGSHQTSRAPRPSQLAAKGESSAAKHSHELRGDLDRIVLKAVALEPELRYDSAAALADDLSRYLDGRPVLATTPSAMYLMRKFIARRKVTSAAILLAAVSLIGGAATAMFGLNRATESKHEAIMQQQRAELEAAVALEINDFWIDILQRGSPQEARRPDLRVREALDLAAPRLSEQIGDPRVRRRLHETFADAYHALGLAVPQLHHARQAHALWQNAADSDPDEAVRAHLTLGRALLEANELGEAREALLEAQALCESNSAVIRHLPEVLQLLARVASSEGAFAEAERILIDAIDRSNRILGPRHPMTLSNEEKLGLTLVKLGRYQEAADRLQPVLNVQRAVLGPDHPDSLATLTVLAMARESLNRLDEAEQDYLILIEQSVLTLGEDHSHILALKHNLAGLLRKMDRHDESEALYWTVREAYLRTGGPDHPNTLAATANLSISLMNQGKYAQCEPLIMEVVEGRTRVLGPEHPLTINAEQSLATVFYFTGRLEEAALQYADLLPRQRRAVPPGAMHLAPLLRNYGATLRELGRADEALPMFIESHDILAAAIGPQHPETQRGWEFVCQTLADLGSAAGYEEWRRRCAE